MHTLNIYFTVKNEIMYLRLKIVKDVIVRPEVVNLIEIRHKPSGKINFTNLEQISNPFNLGTINKTHLVTLFVFIFCLNIILLLLLLLMMLLFWVSLVCLEGFLYFPFCFVLFSVSTVVVLLLFCFVLFCLFVFVLFVCVSE